MSFLQSIFLTVQPYLLEVISIVLALVLARFFAALQTGLGIEVEARHRDALHSALMSGIRAALSRGLTGQAAISAALSHAYSSVPDAIAKLEPEHSTLLNIAESKLREALASSPIVELVSGMAAPPLPTANHPHNQSAGPTVNL